MATLRAYRSFWQLEASSWCWWMQDSGLGDEIEHNGDKLLLSTDGTDSTIYAAVQFESASAPAWTSLGPIAAAGYGLTCKVLKHSSEITTSIGVQVKQITSAWNSASNITTMRALTTSGSASIGGSVPNSSGLNAMYGVTALAPGTYGLLFTINAVYTHNIVLATSPLPVLRYYYQYSSTGAAHANSTERSDYDSATLAVLAGEQGYKRLTIAIDGLRTDREPAKSNASIALLSDGASGVSHEMNFPRAWQPNFPSSGGLTVPLGSYSGEMDKAKGYPVEMVMALQHTNGDSAELCKLIQIVGSTAKGQGTGTLELKSLTESIMSRRLTKWDPAGLISHIDYQYDAETPLYILFDMLMNCTLLPWTMLYYNDLMIVHRRFQNVWSKLTIADTTLEGKVFSDYWDLITPMYGLHNAEVGDGVWSIFHPGVYRPSARLWTVRESKCIIGTFEIKDRNFTGQFNQIVISDDQVAPATSTEEVQDYIPITADWIEKSASFTATGDIFYDAGVSSGADFPMARQALARQHAQYMCGVTRVASGVLGASAVNLQVGDILVIVPTDTTIDPFLAKCYSAALDPNTARKTFTAIEYPDAQGLQSPFTQHGVLGMWRPSTTPATTNELGTDGEWTKESSDYPAVLRSHWQNHLLGGVTMSNDSLLTDTANYCDTVDVTMAGLWKLAYADTARQPSWWNAAQSDTFVPILTWRQASGDVTIALGIFRGGGTGRPNIHENMIAIRCWSEMNSSTYTTAATYYAGMSMLGVDDETVVEDALECASFALSWKDTTIRVYLDRTLVIEATDATYFDKADWAELFLHSSHGGPYPNTGAVGTVGITQTMFASITHIGQDGWITNLSRLNGANGIDPFYGPDDVADLIDI